MQSKICKRALDSVSVVALLKWLAHGRITLDYILSLGLRVYEIMLYEICFLKT